MVGRRVAMVFDGLRFEERPSQRFVDRCIWFADADTRLNKDRRHVPPNYKPRLSLVWKRENDDLFIVFTIRHEIQADAGLIAVSRSPVLDQ